MAEENRIACPLCGSPLRVGKDSAGKKDNRVYCDKYKYDGQSQQSVGECDFVLWLSDGKKAKFGKNLTLADAKKLIAGETVVSPLKHKMTLDKDDAEHGYKKIEWHRKEGEDKFLS